MSKLSIIQRQAAIYEKKLYRLLDNASGTPDVYRAHAAAMKGFYDTVYNPVLPNKEIRDLSKSQIQEIITLTDEDLNVSYNELDLISNNIGEAFNANRDYKTSAKNKIQYLSSLISDINLMTGNSTDSYIVFKDSLNNHDFLDHQFDAGFHATVFTSEGIATLNIESDTNVNKFLSIAEVGNGKGEFGNKHIVTKVDIITADNNYDIYAKYIEEENPRNSIEDVLDGEQQTWVEYATVGIKDSNIEWADAEEFGDTLTLTLEIKLEQATYANWIDISPYLPHKSRNNITIESLLVSLDGNNFSPIYKNMDLINKEINIIPQKYLNDQLFEETYITKAASQGVFYFAQREIQYIKVTFKQEKSYPETLGNTVYYQLQNLNDIGLRIPEEDVPVDILTQPIGTYIHGNNIFKKNIEVLSGWRYCIGIRDISVYNRRFSTTSELTTKQFTTDQNIKSILLYANELIPDEYNVYGLEQRNQWIQYFISVDDVNWLPISPMHHKKLGSTDIPPRIYEINSPTPPALRVIDVDKGYINEPNIRQVRLKCIMQRPKVLPFSTPIIEEYGIKCIFKGETDEY